MLCCYIIVKCFWLNFFICTLKTQTFDCVDNKLLVFVISGLLLCSDHPDKLVAGEERRRGEARNKLDKLGFYPIN